ncbi:MAG: hypothetical protein M1826_007468 [Phylliscum demangeonii]|nr:MAG: hypothetical protein M1826_007468 [Phylliscum demangeonii]
MDVKKLWSSHKDHEKDEQDLGTLLNEDERGALIALVDDVMNNLRAAIEANFTTSLIDADAQAQQEADAKVNPNISTTSSSTAGPEEPSRVPEKPQESSAELKELEIALLGFIAKWRNSVKDRVREAIKSRKVAEHHHDESTIEQVQAGIKKVEVSDAGAPVDEAVSNPYPPVATILAQLPVAKRMLILHSMLLLLLSLEHYTAYSRVLLLRLASSLHIPFKALAEDEIKVARGLLEAAKQMSGDGETQKRAEDNKTSRAWKVGLASVAGAALVGVTGGLAAPLVAAGIGGVMGGLGLGATAAAGYLGTLAGSSMLVGGLFGAYGGRMTGRMIDSYAREVEDFAFLPVHGNEKPSTDAEHATASDRRLRVVIGITGWITAEEEVIAPWRVLGRSAEVFALRYELESLLALGHALSSMISTAIWGKVKSEIIKRTVFASLTAALWPLALLKVSRIVDNPFSVAKARSDKAGDVLADALINRAQGERPVTLIGYSLGARVIYACLKSLAARRAFGLVEAAVLIGAPTPSASSEWRALRTVVAGRLVNVFSANDLVLAFLYRTSSIQYGVAGLQPIDGVHAVENVDVSAIVSGHLRYRFLVGRILNQIAWDDLDPAELAEQDHALRDFERREDEAKKKELPRAADSPSPSSDPTVGDDRAAQMLEAEVLRKARLSQQQQPQAAADGAKSKPSPIEHGS